MMITTVSAYDTIVTLTIDSVYCEHCIYHNSGEYLEGASNSREVCISASSNCGTCISGSSNIAGNRIDESGSYSSGVTSLTSGSIYYACLKLTEMLNSGSNNNCYLANSNSLIYLMDDCFSGGTVVYNSNNYCFNLRNPCGDSQSYTSYIGNANSADQITFSYQFIA